MGITVAVCTYGSEEWADLARSRAIPSAADQAPTIHVHADSLQDARNRALERVKTEHVVYVDADDELEANYIDAMAAGTSDVRVPLVRYTRHGRARHARMPRVYGHKHDCTADCLPEGNWIVIGACARTDLLRDIGGWHDYPVYEDWSTWLRCYLAGATFEIISKAVYRAHVNVTSRNRGTRQSVKARTHEAIYAAAFPDRHAA